MSQHTTKQETETMQTKAPTNIEIAVEIVKHDDSDQSAIEKIHTHKAQLQIDLAVVDDGNKPAIDVIRQQDAIQLEISRLDRQEAVYQKRVKSRLASLLDALKGGKEDHRDAEYKFRDVCKKMADDALEAKAADIENFKDLILATVWLRDTSPRNLLEAIEGALGKKGYFKHSETTEAARRLGLFKEEPVYPEQLKQAEEIINRELGGDWTKQDADWLAEQLNPNPNIGTADDHDEYDNAETTQYLGAIDRRSL